MFGDLICDIGKPRCLNSIAAPDLHSTAPLLMAMPGIHWHADRLEDWVSELGLTTLSDEIADVMLADVMRHWRAAAGSPQVTLIDNIIRDLAVPS